MLHSRHHIPQQSVQATIKLNSTPLPEVKSHYVDIVNAPYMTRGEVDGVQGIKASGGLDVEGQPLVSDGKGRCEVGGDDGCDGCVSGSVEDRRV
jgi:hypothetical protein